MSATATVNYHVSSPGEQAFHIDAGGEVGKIISPVLAPTEVTVEDVRRASVPVDFAHDGVSFVDSASAVTSFGAPDGWEEAYDRELHDLLAREIGAKRTIVFDHTVRVDDPAAAQGFAEPSVEDLRDAAGVSLRTLYKYTPSRNEMVYAALEYRHARYLAHVFDALPDDPEAALPALMDRIAAWMTDETTHGCLFHAAVAAAPGDARLLALLARHKAEVAGRAARAVGLVRHEIELMLIVEGLMQCWPLSGAEAVAGAKRLGETLRRTA